MVKWCKKSAFELTNRPTQPPQVNEMSMNKSEPTHGVLFGKFTWFSLSLSCPTSCQLHVLCVNWRGPPVLDWMHISSGAEQSVASETSNLLQGVSGGSALTDLKSYDSQRLVWRCQSTAVLRSVRLELKTPVWTRSSLWLSDKRERKNRLVSGIRGKDLSLNL